MDKLPEKDTCKKSSFDKLRTSASQTLIGSSAPLLNDWKELESGNLNRVDALSF